MCPLRKFGIANLTSRTLISCVTWQSLILERRCSRDDPRVGLRPIATDDLLWQWERHSDPHTQWIKSQWAARRAPVRPPQFAPVSRKTAKEDARTSRINLRRVADNRIFLARKRGAPGRNSLFNVTRCDHRPDYYNSSANVHFIESILITFW